MATVKGDVRLGNHTLRMDFNALCDAEEDFPGIMRGEVHLDSFRNIRTMIRHALSAHHADLTDREVGEIIHDAGMAQASEAVADAMRASFPEEDAASTANPPKSPAKAGTGKQR